MVRERYSTSVLNPNANRRPLVLFALLAVVGALLLYWAVRPKPTPEERITTAFQETQVAAQRGDIAAATEIVSGSFHAGTINKQRLKLLLFRARQNERGSDWRIEITAPQIFPAPDRSLDKRLVVTRVRASDAASGETLWSTGNAPVTLLMREEKIRVFGVFPSTAWRIVAAPGLPVDTGDW